MNYKPYLAYSAINVKTGDSYPENWPIERLRFSILVNPVRSEVASLPTDTLVSFVPMDAVSEQGDIDASQEKLIEDVYTGYTYFAEQDILLAKITPCFENGKGAIAVGLKNGIGFGTTEFHVLRPLARVACKWLFYLTNTTPFRMNGGARMFGAGGQKRVPEDFVKDYRVGIPPLTEQHQIAAFLDWKTAQIDALIAKKKELITKLKESRAAVIVQAVTRGLDPHVDFKDSNFAWIGKIPKHWTIIRLKFIARVGNGSTPLRDDGAYWNGGTYPWLNSSVVNQEKVTLAEQFVTPTALLECYLPKIIPPAVLIGITGEGKTRGMATTLLFEATINQHLAFVKTDESLAHVGFIRRVFDMAYTYLRSESDGGGSTKGAITCQQISELPIPLPPLNEQNEIATHVDAKLERISKLLEKAEDVIAHLTEYRTALITAATTGKIDVRNVRIPDTAPAAT